MRGEMSKGGRGTGRQPEVGEGQRREMDRGGRGQIDDRMRQRERRKKTHEEREKSRTLLTAKIHARKDLRELRKCVCINRQTDRQINIIID